MSSSVLMANSTATLLGSPMSSSAPREVPSRLLSPFSVSSCLYVLFDSSHLSSWDCVSDTPLANDSTDSIDSLVLLHSTPPTLFSKYPPNTSQCGKQLQFKTPYSQVVNSDLSPTFTGVHTPLGTPLTPRIMSTPLFEQVAIVRKQHRRWNYNDRYPLTSACSEETPTHTLLQMITDDSPKAPSGDATRNMFASYFPTNEHCSIPWRNSLRMVDYIEVAAFDHNYGPLICYLSSTLLVIYSEISGECRSVRLENATVLNGDSSITVIPTDPQCAVLLKFDVDYKYSRWKLALANPYMIIPDELITCITSFERFM